MPSPLKTIEQSVWFPISAKRLYAMYMSPNEHAAITGGAVTISKAPDAPFSAFDGKLAGRMLYCVPGKLIVQRWRSTNWAKNDLDSTLILRFVQEGARGRIDLVHVNVPKHDHKGVTEGWRKYYWQPWKAYLGIKKPR